MNNPGAIRKLADERLEEAKCLCMNGHYDLAFYTAGYAVEFLLKAKICETLGIANFFDFDNRKKFSNEGEIMKPYKVHDFSQLLILSGTF